MQNQSVVIMEVIFVIRFSIIKRDRHSPQSLTELA
jgi:hypothetical protein